MCVRALTVASWVRLSQESVTKSPSPSLPLPVGCQKLCSKSSQTGPRSGENSWIWRGSWRRMSCASATARRTTCRSNASVPKRRLKRYRRWHCYTQIPTSLRKQLLSHQFALCGCLSCSFMTLQEGVILNFQPKLKCGDLAVLLRQMLNLWLSKLMKTTNIFFNKYTWIVFVCAHRWFLADLLYHLGVCQANVHSGVAASCRPLASMSGKLPAYERSSSPFARVWRRKKPSSWTMTAGFIASRIKSSFWSRTIRPQR